MRVMVVAVFSGLLACHGSKDAPAPAPSNLPAPVVPANAVWRDPPVSAKVTQIATLFAPPPKVVDPAPVAAPWSLTASDGSGIVLTRVDAKAVVEGPLAFTQLDLYFHNPEARVREGTFSITLPTDAAVSRFAMETDGKLSEAEVVEKQLARRAYEDFLHRKQDPALLEKGAGNQFSARVFPIAASGDKHLVLSFSQAVSPGHYELPLRGLANSQRIDVRVQIRGTGGEIFEQTFSQRDWTPDRDIVVDGFDVGSASSVIAGEVAATRVKIQMADAAAPPAGVTLLVDTSASRALGFAAQMHQVHALVDELARSYGAALPVQVVAFDQVTEPIYDGRADGATDIEAALVKRGALGASDLGQALAWVGAHAPKSRIVVVTDGVITAGATLPMAQLPGVDRIDVVLAGGIRDAQAAAAIAQAKLPHVGAVLDLDRGAPEVARRIGLAVQTQLAVTASGARWLSPSTIAAAQPGDEVTVYLRRDPLVADLAVTIAGTTTKLSPISVSPVLLGRAVEGAEIAELDARFAKAPDDKKLRAEIVKRSIAARVVSSQTSMLVLPSDDDFARFGISRTTLADILTIGPDGVGVLHRAVAPQIAAVDDSSTRSNSTSQDDPPPPPEDKPDDNENDSGGTGTRMALDEGKMGKKDSDRAEGQYKMKREDSPPPAAPDPEPDRATANAQLAKLQQEKAALDLRVDAARATAAHAERLSALHESQQCLNNPLAAGCFEGDDHVPSSANDDESDENRKAPALQGQLAEIETALAKRDVDAALAQATAWHAKEPGDILALIGMGDALEAKKDAVTAARVYGSIIDLYPDRADFRRFAAERLERLGDAERALALDSYQRAVVQRPDHLTGHRLLAYALLRDGKLAEAFAAILAGIDQDYPADRFRGAARVLAEDAGMIGAAYIAREPAKRAEVVAALTAHELKLATQPSTRFIMYWETDANDVDFHIRDARGGHAWYKHMRLASGGELYADITTGYGPECFAIQGAPRAAPYALSINYYSQGPMGYGMGLLQIQKFDGKGGLTFEDRPYVIMTDHAFVDLGTYR